MRTRHLIVTKDYGLPYTMRLNDWDWGLDTKIYGQLSLDYGVGDLDSIA